MSGEHPEPLGWELAGCRFCPDGVSSGPCKKPSSADQLRAHNGPATDYLPSHQMKMRGVWYIKSILDCQATQIEIHHWHLGFVWWPEMERLDFRCLKLNCTAGVQQTREGKQSINWWISKANKRCKQRINCIEKVILMGDSEVLMEFSFLSCAINMTVSLSVPFQVSCQPGKKEAVCVASHHFYFYTFAWL